MSMAMFNSKLLNYQRVGKLLFKLKAYRMPYGCHTEVMEVNG